MLYNTEWEKKVTEKKQSWQKLLLKAADLIEEHGWIRYNYANKNGYCIMGALERCSLDDNNAASLVSALLELESVVGAICAYNDERAANAEEVIHLLRRVAGG